MLIFANICLLLGSILGGLVLFRQSEPLNAADKTLASLYLLSSLFVASFAILSLIIQPTANDLAGTDSSTLLRFFSNLAYFIALPLMASLLFAKRMEKNWTRMYWGRWVLFLFAMFELTRRMGYGEQYSTVMSIFMLVVLLACFSGRGYIIQGLTGTVLLAMALCLGRQISAFNLDVGLNLLSEDWRTSGGSTQVLSALCLACGLYLQGLATSKLMAKS